MQKKCKYIVIAAGGTGGHLFPAQAFARDLKKRQEDCSIVFMGKGLESNRFFHKDIFAYKEIEAVPFSLKNPFLVFSLLGKGVWQAFCLFGKKRPLLVVGFGSFHSFPVLLAALLRRIPIALFESNAIAGKVNRFFSKYADFTAVQLHCACKNLKNKCIEVHMPYWRFQEEDLLMKSEIKQKAMNYFSLRSDSFTFLVFGGSQGAASINTFFMQALSSLKRKAGEIQVIHIIGKGGDQQEIENQYKELGVLACVKPFESQMDLAWTFADVAVCRSGAATLSELMLFEVPSILIPYPYAADQHQLRNAEFMVEIGGSLLIEERDLKEGCLGALLEKFMHPNREVIDRAKCSIIEYKKGEKRRNLCDLVENYLT